MSNIGTVCNSVDSVLLVVWKYSCLQLPTCSRQASKQCGHLQCKHPGSPATTRRRTALSMKGRMLRCACRQRPDQKNTVAAKMVRHISCSLAQNTTEYHRVLSLSSRDPMKRVDGICVTQGNICMLKHPYTAKHQDLAKTKSEYHHIPSARLSFKRV